MTPHLAIASDILLPEIERLLGEGKDVRFTPSGVSMRPFIEGDRDSVILSPLNRAPRRGDIVLARMPVAKDRNTYILHRLIRIERDPQNEQEKIYILQGDGNLAGEEICRREWLVALVTAIERPDGRKKCLTRGYVWYALKPIRKYLLKIYRHL